MDCDDENAEFSWPCMLRVCSVSLLQPKSQDGGMHSSGFTPGGATSGVGIACTSRVKGSAKRAIVEAIILEDPGRYLV
jgi:hypothetical protein